MLSTKRFDDHFEVVLADTPESRHIHYQLRYQVYCDELGFEDKHRFPDGLEYDDWDAHSVHFIVRHRLSGQWLGALRLAHHRHYQFPFETKTPPYEQLQSTEYASNVEISRLCIIKDVRRQGLSRKKSAYLTDHQPTTTQNISYESDYFRLNRNLMWGLIRTAAVYSSENNIKDWFVLISPSLAHILTKGGLELTQIGLPCEHKGQRIPYMLNVEKVLGNTLWEKDYQKRYVKYSDTAPHFLCCDRPTGLIQKIDAPCALF